MYRVTVFPGQGSQVVGMGADLWDHFPREVEQADDILGYSIRRLCMDDPENNLMETEYTQPALYVVSALTYMDRQRKGHPPPDAVAGSSLGAYAALYAAGAFDFATGLRLVRKRGALMAQARGGGMAAVIGLKVQLVRTALAQQGLNEVEVVNDNSPSQLVISGPLDAVRAASEPLLAAGARHCVELKTSAAFHHSRAMRPAAEAFRRFIDPVEFQPLRFSVMSNITAEPYNDAAIHDLLWQQICSPVRWRECIEYMLDRGATEFTECGPGRVLTDLIREIRKIRIGAQV
ncbi:ACP S-malonyltransferase [Mycobacterium sp.]|uniref:ACP S-malonyltransferase n=1 Tax=Mycobacterium sp. TaxID=1785 RepID=UPI003BA93D40